jgi:predicted NBD/HSP70 family sugar kinase
MAAEPSDTPVRQRSLRTHNLGLVLRHVADQRMPVSRAEVSAATGLTKATVSSLVEELLGGQLLAEVAPPPPVGAGRPAVGLRLGDTGPAGLGLEVNVDYLAGCVVDLTGAVRGHEVHHADQRGRPAPDVLEDVTALAATMIRAAAEGGLTVAGATLAVPGLVADGLVRLAPNLGWQDVDIAATLPRRAPFNALPLGMFTVDNEANLAALGELHAWSSPRARPSFLYISGEIGIGAGIVRDGRLHRGGHGFGGEFGHTTVQADGPRCRCGARGCLEVFANLDVLVRTAGIRPGPGALARLTALARSQAPAALEALAAGGTTLGVATASVVNVLDLDAVVLGGAFAPLAPWLAPPIAREITERVLAARWTPVAVRASVLGETATVTGAAGSVVRAIREAPASWLALVKTSMLG